MSAETFEHRLVETGGAVFTAMEGAGQGYGRDAEFCYLWDDNSVAVALRSNFDRWANSRDFVLHRVIQRVDLDKLRHACHLAMDRGHLDAGWALEFDVAQYYRKARRGKA